MTSQYLRSTFSSLREYLTPITHTSTFATTGEITPEEFIKAGDYLVYRFPTWQWSPADSSKMKDFLPHDKQFLVTRHVPSYVRASDYELALDDDDEEEEVVEEEAEDDGKAKEDAGKNEYDGKKSRIRKEDDFDSISTEGDNLDNEGWTTTNSTGLSTGKQNDYGVDDDIDERSIKEISDDDSEIKDIDELIDEDAEDVEFVDNKLTEKTPKASKKRSYDLYITYSTSYRVPKMYLVGFDSNSVPLTPHQMFEDIASDYRHKTVTIEKAPFLRNTTAVSIHPCKHATVMKVLMKRAAAAAKEKSHKEESDKLIKQVSKLGLKDSHDSTALKDGNYKGNGDDEEEWETLEDEEHYGIRVDQYLVVFLKFISSVTPGIEHDYTMEAL